MDRSSHDRHACQVRVAIRLASEDPNLERAALAETVSLARVGGSQALVGVRCTVVVLGDSRTERSGAPRLGHEVVVFEPFHDRGPTRRAIRGVTALLPVERRLELGARERVLEIAE